MSDMFFFHSSTSRLLALPAELRFEVYEAFLQTHKHVRYLEQPSNQHLRLLLTCKQIHVEAKPILQKYVSLLYERQIAAFIKSNVDFVHVTHVDVANDGRLVERTEVNQGVLFFLKSLLTEHGLGRETSFTTTPRAAPYVLVRTPASLRM